MQTTLVVTGHGEYATGIASAVQVIAGESEYVRYLNFQAERGTSELRSEMRKLLDQHTDQAVVFVCDILGGTPFKVAAELSINYDNVHVIAGCNINGMIEGVLAAGTLAAPELAAMMIETTKGTAVPFQVLPVQKAMTVNQEGL